MKTRQRYGKKQKKRRVMNAPPPVLLTDREESQPLQNLNSVTACPEEFQWQQVTDLQKFAARLLDQQLWCFGQDIEHPAGNLLLKYGFEKQSAPGHLKSVSLYRYENGSNCQLLLRGFGLFYGDERWGGLFLRRCEFNPLYWSSAFLLKTPWKVEDLPQFRQIGEAEEKASRELIREMLGLICNYEQWVVKHYGLDYREKSLQLWQNSKKQVVRGSEMIAAWKKIAANWSPVT